MVTGFFAMMIALIFWAFGKAYALTANAEVGVYVDQVIRTFPLGADVVLYKGALVGKDPAGYAKAFVPGDVFVGIAYEAKDNTDGDAGDVSARVLVEGDFDYTLASVAVSDTSKPVYATADNAIALTGHPDAYVGRVLGYVSSNTAIIRMRPEFKRTLGDGSCIDIDIDFAKQGMTAIGVAGTAAVNFGGSILCSIVGAGITPAGTTGLMMDEANGELKALIDNDNEAENITIQTPQVFNITKGITFEFEGRNSVAGGAATDDMDFGLAGLSGGLTATQRADMNATTAGLLSALFHIDCNALTAYASSDDNSAPVAATAISAANVLATNKRWKIIVRPTGVVEFWVNEVRQVSTTVFSVGASGLLAGIVNLEKSTGTGVPEARIRRLRVAGAIA